jgi:hypothetical protein
MILKKIVCICPECESTINAHFDDIEFSMIDHEVKLSLECPECGASIDEEVLEADE